MTPGPTFHEEIAPDLAEYKAAKAGAGKSHVVLYDAARTEGQSMPAAQQADRFGGSPSHR